MVSRLPEDCRKGLHRVSISSLGFTLGLVHHVYVVLIWLLNCILCPKLTMCVYSYKESCFDVLCFIFRKLDCVRMTQGEPYLLNACVNRGDVEILSTT